MTQTKQATSPGALTPVGSKEWVWTKTKKKALELVLQGYSVRKVAEAVGKHYTTIHAWKHHPEFQTRLLRDVKDYVEGKRYRRVHETGIIADQLATSVAKVFKRINDAGDNGPKQIDLNQLQLFLREYRDFREQERSDFGDRVSRFEGQLLVGVTHETKAGEGQETSKLDQSLKDFFVTHGDRVASIVIDPAKPQEALIAATESLLLSTDLLDQIHEEDRAQADADAQEKHKVTRKR